MKFRWTLLAQGWTDADDADFLRDDPALRLAVSRRRQDALLRTPESWGVPDGLASQPTLSRLLEAAASPHNESVLQEACLRATHRQACLRATHRQANLFCAQQRRRWVEGRKRYEYLTVDVDSFPVKVHGHQADSAYNGYYHQRCYHPLLFGSADIHTLFGAVLRPGNVHTSNGAAEELTKYPGWVETRLADEIAVRGDAGFPGDDLLSLLEKRHCPYVFRFTRYKPLEVKAQPYSGPVSAGPARAPGGGEAGGVPLLRNALQGR